jgi:hypothetical protein
MVFLFFSHYILTFSLQRCKVGQGSKSNSGKTPKEISEIYATRYFERESAFENNYPQMDLKPNNIGNSTFFGYQV